MGINTLLGEDEAIIAMSEKMKLGDYCYEVLTVSNGEKAVDLAPANPNIDLILMDTDLGKENDGTEGVLTFNK